MLKTEIISASLASVIHERTFFTFHRIVIIITRTMFMVLSS